MDRKLRCLSHKKPHKNDDDALDTRQTRSASESAANYIHLFHTRRSIFISSPANRTIKQRTNTLKIAKFNMYSLSELFCHIAKILEGNYPRILVRNVVIWKVILRRQCFNSVLY